MWVWACACLSTSPARRRFALRQRARRGRQLGRAQKLRDHGGRRARDAVQAGRAWHRPARRPRSGPRRARARPLGPSLLRSSSPRRPGAASHHRESTRPPHHAALAAPLPSARAAHGICTQPLLGTRPRSSPLAHPAGFALRFACRGNGRRRGGGEASRTAWRLPPHRVAERCREAAWQHVTCRLGVDSAGDSFCCLRRLRHRPRFTSRAAGDMPYARRPGRCVVAH